MTKVDFVRRFKKGEFGNRSPIWDNVEDLEVSGHNGLIHLRNRVVAGETYYNLTLEESVKKWKKIADKESWFCAAMAPEDRKVFQGELMRSIQGYSLFYSLLPLPMRDGLKADGKQVYGSVAVRLLQHFLCVNSYEWMMYLLDTYDDHVIEFSTYDVKYGTVPNFNTLYWEVRRGY